MKIQAKVMKKAHEIKNQFENFGKALKHAWAVVKGIVSEVVEKVKSIFTINLQKKELKKVYFTGKTDMPSTLKDKLKDWANLYHKDNWVRWYNKTQEIITKLINLNSLCSLKLELIDNIWHISSPDNKHFKAQLLAS